MQALHYYAQDAPGHVAGTGPSEDGHVPADHVSMDNQAKARTLYRQLRQNVIENLFQNYQTKGYLFENYRPEDGEGVRCHPFTGWSSLVVLMMAEDY